MFFKKIDVLFYVEHVNREMETVKKIIEELNKNRELRIGIASTAFSMGLSKIIYSPKIVVSPWAYIDKDVKRLLSFPFQNPNIINLHHEQIGNENTQDYFVPKGLAKEVYHVSWGRNYSNLLRKNQIDNQKIKEVGSVRMELASDIRYKREDLKKCFNKEIDINKKWILFISSFSWKKIDVLMKENFKKRGLKYIEKFQSVSEKSYQKTLEYIEYFLKKNPDIEYIYRLHPSEQKDEKLEFLEKKYKNFYINKDYEVKEWIYNSDYIDLWISTSLNEIVSLNKKFRIIRPVELDSKLEINYFKNLKKVESQIDFLNLEYFTESNLKNAMEELKKYYRFDLKPSNEIAKLILNLLDRKDDKKIQIDNKIVIFFKEIIKDLTKIIIYYSPLKISRMERMRKDFFIKKEFFKSKY